MAAKSGAQLTAQHFGVNGSNIRPGQFSPLLLLNYTVALTPLALLLALAQLHDGGMGILI